MARSTRELGAPRQAGWTPQELPCPRCSGRPATGREAEGCGCCEEIRLELRCGGKPSEGSPPPRCPGESWMRERQDAAFGQPLLVCVRDSGQARLLDPLPSTDLNLRRVQKVGRVLCLPVQRGHVEGAMPGLPGGPDTGALPTPTAAGGGLQRGTCQDPYGPEGDMRPSLLSEGPVLLAGDMLPVTRGDLRPLLPHVHSLSAPGLEAQS